MKLIMTEEYHGVVDHVGNDTVTVVYWVNGGPLEQTYERKQFIDGKLPEVCQHVRVKVEVHAVDPPEPPPYDPAEDDKPTNRKPLTGPEVL